MIANIVASDGFVIIPSVFSAQEVCRQLGGVVEPVRASRAGIRHLMSSPAVAALAASEPLVSIAKAILGCDPLPFRVTLFDKSDLANWLVPWHQDTALPLRQRRDLEGWGPWSVKDGIVYGHAPTSALDQVVALRLHLDDSTEENGPLRVLPGTHKLGVLSDDEVAVLAGQQTAEACTAAHGDGVGMRPLLIHASSKSQNGARRRVLHIEYARSQWLGEGLELAIA
jgi:ectoine hydroxylase-related dioxygenase (phytanoyl-CoA dioxygenase family)